MLKSSHQMKFALTGKFVKYVRKDSIILFWMLLRSGPYRYCGFRSSKSIQLKTITADINQLESVVFLLTEGWGSNSKHQLGCMPQLQTDPVAISSRFAAQPSRLRIAHLCHRWRSALELIIRDANQMQLWNCIRQSGCSDRQSENGRAVVLRNLVV